MTHIRSVFAGLFLITAGTAPALGAKPLDTVPVNEPAADAVTGPSVFSYTYGELGYSQQTDDDSDIKSDGFGVAGSFALDEIIGLPLYATAGYTILETEKFPSGGSREITDLFLGAGYRFPLSAALDLNTELEVVQEDQKPKGSFAGAPDDNTGFRLGVGARFQIAPQFEVGGGVTYADVRADSETIIGVNGIYHIAMGFSAILNAFTSSEATGFGLTGRYNFSF